MVAVHFIVWCHINRCVTIDRHVQCIALHRSMQSWCHCKPHRHCGELLNQVAYRMQCTIGCNDQPAPMQWWMQCATGSHIECAPCAIPLCALGEPLRCGLDMEIALPHSTQMCHQRPSYIDSRLMFTTVSWFAAPLPRGPAVRLFLFNITYIY